MIIIAHSLGLQFLIAGTKTAEKATLIDFEAMRRFDGIGVQSTIKYGEWEEYRGSFTAADILRMFNAHSSPWEQIPMMQDDVLMMMIRKEEIRREWCRYYYLALHSYSGVTALEATTRAWVQFRRAYKESMTKDGEWERR